jgi:hypothetical protein
MIASLVLAAAPLVYWAGPVDSAPALQAAGIAHPCVPAAAVEGWKAAGFEPSACSASGREKLTALGLAPRTEVASPTQRPWIFANGWRFLRRPAERYWYELPAGRASLAVAEAFAYGVDAVVALAPDDLVGVGRALAFVEGVPPRELPAVADATVVDDGSAEIPEVLNLLSRRNILYAVSPKAPKAKDGLVVRLGKKPFRRDDAADPDAFALKVRRAIGDERRSLRLFGTEVVIGRVEGDAQRRRVHLLNYSGRPLEGIRVRLRGRWSIPEVLALGEAAVAEDYALAAGATEVSVSVVGAYAVLDFARVP